MQIYFCKIIVKIVKQRLEQHTLKGFIPFNLFFVKTVFIATIFTFYFFFDVHEKTSYGLGLVGMKLLSI